MQDAPPLPIPTKPKNFCGDEEEDVDHNIISVVLNPKTVKFQGDLAQSIENERNWSSLADDYYNRGRKGTHGRGRKTRKSRLIEDRKGGQPDSNFDSLHNFIMSPLHNL